MLLLQKARLARIRIAKASSGAAFVIKKKAAEARLAALESGLVPDDSYKEEDIFELQHHHLLRCLESTTVCLHLFMIYMKLNVTFQLVDFFVNIWELKKTFNCYLHKFMDIEVAQLSNQWGIFIIDFGKCLRYKSASHFLFQDFYFWN